MDRIVSLSGGATSAVCAEKVIQRYGTKDITLWFADTLVEDKDLYRFLLDLERRWGIPIDRHREGRTPLQVAEDEHIIPNQKIAPCTFRLKIDLFTQYLVNAEKPVVVYLGMGWDEKHRMETPRRRYEAFEGVTVDYPSLWEPVDRRPPFEIIRSWGLAPPQMYAQGYSHNNCGGACVKQGIKDWVRTLHWKPLLYAYYEEWENRMRENPIHANYAFCRDQSGGTVRPLTLTQIRTRYGRALEESPGPEDDAGGCLQCSI